MRTATLGVALLAGGGGCNRDSPEDPNTTVPVTTVGSTGDGTTTSRLQPVQIGAMAWFSVSAGDSHTCAIRSTSTLYCWGGNGRGQVGDGTTDDRSSPLLIGSSRPAFRRYWYRPVISATRVGEHTAEFE